MAKARKKRSRQAPAPLLGPGFFWVLGTLVLGAYFVFRGPPRRPPPRARAAPLPIRMVEQGNKEPIVKTVREMRRQRGEAKRKMNHLAGEKSPYLLQHVYNPVDWHPWGERAFAKARRENKPIFLSIGYSTCHWCHVMERESFTNEKIAAVLNKYFVAIKVDREERPDIDKVYMTLATGAGWGGGWPLNLWLTPEREPFFGGTYFPPRPQWGRPGLPQVAERIGRMWRENRDALLGDAKRLAEALRRHAVLEGREAQFDPKWLDSAFAAFRDASDRVNGGFGGSPKFPMPVNQNFLLRYYARTGNKQALEIVRKTLRAMAAGGIYDHVGGGFARYSVDGEWRVPHFEKMLYDNAQLAVNYIEAYQAGRDPESARVAGETLDYVLRDMTHPRGGFYSAEDADSLPPESAAPGARDEGREHKAEGAFYLWTEGELSRVLGAEAEMFAYRYGVRPGGNAPADPRGEFAGKNILYAEHAPVETAKEFGRSERETRRILKAALAKLREVRAKRPRPGLDDKVLSSWNGLMISAFAKGYQALETPEYLAAAEKAAGFLRDNLYDRKSGKLYHRWRQGDRAVEGMADDYAFLAQGALDLYEASFDPQWLEWSLALMETLQKGFYDEGKGGYFMTAKGGAKALLTRMIEDSDNVEPSASAVAAHVLLRLDRLLHREDLRTAAEKTIHRFGLQLRDQPLSSAQLLVAADFAASQPRQIIIAGGLDEPATREMLRMARARYRPTETVMVIPSRDARERIGKLAPQVRGMTAEGGKPTAYICLNFACDLPTTNVAQVAKMLRER